MIQKNQTGVLIEKPVDIDWKLTKETKKINNYKCFKASLQMKFKTRSGDSQIRDVIAWYAPELPYSFGPAEFQGLPGLILELTNKKTTYLATKIEFSKREIPIIFPKGKTITKEAYDAKLKAQMGM